MELTLLTTAIVAVMAFGFAFYRYGLADKPGKPMIHSRGYNMFYSPWCVFIYPAVRILLDFCGKQMGYQPGDILTELVSYLFMIIFTMVVYYAVLYIVTKLFREKLYADTIVLLWMLPGLLYFRLINSNDAEPSVIIPISGKIVMIGIIIWILGFIIKFGQAYYVHKKFVGEVMSDAREVTVSDEQQRLWVLKKEIALILQQNHNLKEKQFDAIKVYVSGKVKTPLTIGFSYGSAKIVLPNREYSTKELSWIFRHELIHIVHGDPANKLFMTVTSDLLWFFPLYQWLTNRAFEDIELACDEKVLGGADEEIKRFYGNLVLNTAGESRGFTSCLSANASSMRYRLQKIMNPVEKYPARNIWIVTLMAVILTFSYGNITLAVDPKPISQVIVDIDPGFSMEECHLNRKEKDINPEDLKTFLEQTKVYAIEGTYYTDYENDSLFFALEDNGKEYELLFDGHGVYVWVRNDWHMTFYLPEKNWQEAWTKLGLELPK
ncbi:MAG: M56 family metallopeptidase [Lachnospiraceae bacterium]|nr:M56 family metallopeptidase [Lachnospiraceae bacterium]